MVNIPLAKMAFHLDNGLGEQLSGTGLSATYNFVEKKIVWRKWGKDSVDNQLNMTQKILSLLPLSSPLLIVPLLLFLGNYSQTVATPVERFHVYSFVLPVVLGITLFISFESLMVYIMERPKIIEAPDIAVQKQYFKGVYDFSIKYNNAVGNYKTPYLVSIVVAIFVCFIAVPLMFWIYNQPDTTGTFVAKLFMLGFLLSLIPNLIWNLLIKGILTNKIIKKLENEMEK